MENLKTYKFADDGSQMIAESAAQIVAFMRDGGRFTAAQTIEAYMEGFADRYRVETGNMVRCNSVEAFVADLLECGFLTQLVCVGACLPHGVKEIKKGQRVEVYCGCCERLMAVD